jgi:hypothetical protein
MSTIDPNSSQAAIFAKLGISQTSDTQKAKKDTLRSIRLFKVNDHPATEPRSICPNG